MTINQGGSAFVAGLGEPLVKNVQFFTKPGAVPDWVVVGIDLDMQWSEHITNKRG